MRRQEATARRYAKALFQVAREARRLDAVGDELANVLEVLAADRRLEEFLSRPWIKGATKRSVAAAVAERLGGSPLVRDFVGLVAQRGRMDHLAEIARAYRSLLDAERGRLAVGLARIAGKEVIVEGSVDARLLGGFVAQIGSLVLDGSLDGQLTRMRERLVRG
ncbi:MAG: F0F1 ATP synthase subunit delta [Candidatus Rokubacteria bacterium]|nr:F0F1 ATP synthase subunit delta [Candidatus Rokubacteria bacterium]